MRESASPLIYGRRSPVRLLPCILYFTTVHRSAHIRFHLHSPSTLGPITGGAHTCKRGKSPIPP